MLSWLILVLVSCSLTLNSNLLLKIKFQTHCDSWGLLLIYFRTHQPSFFASQAQNPGMLKYLLGWVSLKGVYHQRPGDELLGGIGYIVPVWGIELEKAREDLVEEFLLVVCPTGKRRIPAEKNVEDDSHRPNIDLRMLRIDIAYNVRLIIKLRVFSQVLVNSWISLRNVKRGPWARSCNDQVKV